MRRFLEEFADSNNFDYLVPQNWYPMYPLFRQMKVALLPSCPPPLFPSSPPPLLPSSPPPLLPSSPPPLKVPQVTISMAHYFLSQGAKSILFQYKWNFIEALKDLLPELCFDDSKFSRSARMITPTPFLLMILSLLINMKSAGGLWQETNTRRDYFFNFAKSKGFDPLIPINWYSLHRNSFLYSKVL